jgi:hypothetical protein
VEENFNAQSECSRYELRPWEIILVWVFVVIVVVVIGIFYNLRPCPGASIDKWGQFGDSFGMINWFVSLLSLTGVAFTAISVKEQIGLMRKQLKAQEVFNKDQLELQAALELIQYYQAKLSALPKVVNEQLHYSLPGTTFTGIATPAGQTHHANNNAEVEAKRQDYEQKIIRLREKLEGHVSF